MQNKRIQIREQPPKGASWEHQLFHKNETSSIFTDIIEKVLELQIRKERAEISQQKAMRIWIQLLASKKLPKQMGTTPSKKEAAPRNINFFPFTQAQYIKEHSSGVRCLEFLDGDRYLFNLMF